MFREQARKRLTKKAKKGFRGFPVATVALYGQGSRIKPIYPYAGSTGASQVSSFGGFSRVREPRPLRNQPKHRIADLHA